MNLFSVSSRQWAVGSKQLISKAEVSDVTALNFLINSAYRGESSKAGWTTEADMLGGQRTDEEDLKTIISKPDCTFLKYTNEGGEIIGCVRLEKHSEKMYLGMLTVLPTLQNAGIGKQLMHASEQFAKEQNCKSVYMQVIYGRNELVEWYERQGYSDTGERKPFPMSDPRFGIPKKELEFIIMEKQIAHPSLPKGRLTNTHAFDD
jgi:GNAT superfamily N-acetyltransferase